MTKVAGAALSLPPNMSVAAAMSAGLLSTNTLIATVNGVAVGTANPTVSALIAAGVLDPSQPASVLGFSTNGPEYGGD
jgi:hypothetical protein